MQGFALLLNTLLNTNQSSIPFLSRQIQSDDITSGVKTALHGHYLPSFPIHADLFFHCPIHDTCIVAYHPDSPSIDDLHSFLTRLTYSAVILPFILVLRVWSNCKMPRYLKPSSSSSPMGWSWGRSTPLLSTFLPLLISNTAHLSSPHDILKSSEEILPLE